MSLNYFDYWHGIGVISWTYGSGPLQRFLTSMYLKYLRDIHSWFRRSLYSFKTLSGIHKYWFESPKSEKSIQIQPTRVCWVYDESESSKAMNIE